MDNSTDFQIALFMKKKKAEKDTPPLPFFPCGLKPRFKGLLRVLFHDFLAFVEAAALANPVRSFILTAVRALYELRSIHLPDVGATLIPSCL